MQAIPSGYNESTERPIGALLLAVQAVHWVLQLWKTGEYVNQNKKADHFSSDIYADYSVALLGKGGKGKGIKTVRRVTKFCPQYSCGTSSTEWISPWPQRSTWSYLLVGGVGRPAAVGQRLTMWLCSLMTTM
ncbi:hypothetical protein B0H17DRAFT_1143122 [Mycena rosella]|uniref:Uncharacterized protein n=1 Tax=Mycena rosella TaxID=1033263 RepID=A0AAD7G4B9_MYCRO|nr:hypothetical protein B0H17DRAFT_1143122 [Mycena rosella]